MIRFLLCTVLRWHKPHDSCNPRWSIYWCCVRCGDMQLGGLGRAARRR